jgi:hypothetical protein
MHKMSLAHEGRQERLTERLTHHRAIRSRLLAGCTVAPDIDASCVGNRAETTRASNVGAQAQML